MVALESAEKEVRVLILAGDKITVQGKDRLAELDEWAFGIAKTFAPGKDKSGKAEWEGEGDEIRFMRFMAFSAKCAAARAQFESPRYAAIAVANQGEKVPDIYKRDPYKVMDEILNRAEWLQRAATGRFRTFWPSADRAGASCSTAVAGEGRRRANKLPPTACSPDPATPAQLLIERLPK